MKNDIPYIDRNHITNNEPQVFLYYIFRFYDINYNKNTPPHKSKATTTLLSINYDLRDNF